MKIRQFGWFLILVLLLSFANPLLAQEETSLSDKKKLSEEAVRRAKDDISTIFRAAPPIQKTSVPVDGPVDPNNIPPDELRTQLSIQASVSKSQLTIGEQTTYLLEILGPKGVILEFPPEMDMGGFEIKEWGELESKKAGSHQWKQGRWYRLDTLTVGSYIIPPQKVQVRFPDGRARSLKSQQIFVEVKSVIPEGEEASLRDIKPPLSLSAGFPTYLVLAVLAGFGSLILLCIFLFYCRRERRVSIPAPLSAHEAALQELARIESLGLIDQGKVKEYYYLISQCMRQYIEKRFSLRAPEQTTEEFLESIGERKDFPQEHQQLFQQYLTHCDLVKYAKLIPQPSDYEKIAQTTRQFIEETKETVSREGVRQS